MSREDSTTFSAVGDQSRPLPSSRDIAHFNSKIPDELREDCDRISSASSPSRKASILLSGNSYFRSTALSPGGRDGRLTNDLTLRNDTTDRINISSQSCHDTQSPIMKTGTIGGPLRPRPTLQMCGAVNACPEAGYHSTSSSPLARKADLSTGTLLPSSPLDGLGSSTRLTPSTRPSTSSLTPSPIGQRRPPSSLTFITTPSPGDKNLFASGNLPESTILEQDNKLKEIMSQTGMLLLNNNQRVPVTTDDLELVDDLGNGTCGHVVKMRHRCTGQVIAVKQMRRTGNSDENKRIVMDLDVVLKSHDCENIVLCLGCFITDSEVWICMELMSTCFDKLLKQVQQPIPEQICGKVAVSTLKALHYLKERHRVIHRDVKPSNILLDENGRIKLCDFGISGRLVDSKAKTRSAGCAAYMAPERINPPNPSKPDYDIRADVWSLGITLVEMAMGHFPYRDCKTDFELLTKVLEDDPPILAPNQGFSNEFCSFVRDCLMKNYRDRPKYKKLLLHPFILKYESERVDVGAWYASTTKNGKSTSRSTFPDSSLGLVKTESHYTNLIAHEDKYKTKVSSVPLSISTPQAGSNQSISSSGVGGIYSTPSDRNSFKPQPSPRVTRSWKPSAVSSPEQTKPLHSSSTNSSSRRPRSDFSRDCKPDMFFPSSPAQRGDIVPSNSVSGYQRFGGRGLPSSPSCGDYYRSTPHSTGPTISTNKYPPPTLHTYSTDPLNARFRTMKPTVSNSSVSIGKNRPPSSSGCATLLSKDTNHPPSLAFSHIQKPGTVLGSEQDTRVTKYCPDTNKFEFTYPQNSIQVSKKVSDSGPSRSSSHLFHQYRTGLSNKSIEPSLIKTGTTASIGEDPIGPSISNHESRHHWRQSRTLIPFSTASGSEGSERLDSAKEREKPGTVRGPPSRTASQDRQSRGGSYFSNWRSMGGWNWQSPISLRRFRNSSSDRGNNSFDSTNRRLQPCYRSWNEKDSCTAPSYVNQQLNRK